MSRQLASLSRRALLRIASVTPLAMLPLGTQSRAQDKLCEWVQEECVGVVVDSAKLVKVALRLLQDFEQGSGGRAMTPEAIQKAIEMSGGYVICNLEEFDADGNHQDTSDCCRTCGEKADKNAGWFGDISADEFEQAWCDTRDDMIERCIQREMLNGMTRTQAEQHCQVNRSGMGCG